MHAVKKGRRLENKKIELDIGMVQKKRDKTGMGYESLHTMELLSVQCLQVDDVIPILSPGLDNSYEQALSCYVQDIFPHCNVC